MRAQFRCRAPRWFAVALVATVFGVGATPAWSEPDPEQAALSAEATGEITARVQSQVTGAQAAERRAQDAFGALSARRDDAAGNARALAERARAKQAQVFEMDNQLQNTDESVGEMRRRIEAAAAALWRSQAGVVVSESPSDAYVESVRRNTYGRSSGEIPRELITQYRQERKALEVLRNRADNERAEIEMQRQAADLVVEDLDRLVVGAERALAGAQARRARWEALVSAPATPIMSASPLSAAEIAGWFVSTGKVARLGVDDAGAPMTIEKLAVYFIDEGNRYGIRGDIAFAQAIHETGYFSFPSYGQVRPEDNNFAGIGACNSCERGYAYPNARIGARAQMQLLRNYSDPNIREATLPGGDKALFPNYDRFFLRGVARVWTDLNGRWAVPGSTYGQAIHRTYLSMYAWAVERTTAPALLAPPPPKSAPVTTTTSTVPGPGSVLVRPATPVAQ